MQVSTLMSQHPSLDRKQDIHFAKLLLGLAAREAADGNPRGISRNHLGAAFLAQFQIQSSLNNAEKVLRFGIFMCIYTSVQPSDGAFHGFSDSDAIRGGCGNDVV